MASLGVVAGAELQVALERYTQEGAQPSFTMLWGEVKGVGSLRSVTSEGERLEGAFFFGEAGIVACVPLQSLDAGESYSVNSFPGGAFWGMLYDRSHFRNIPLTRRGIEDPVEAARVAVSEEIERGRSFTEVAPRLLAASPELSSRAHSLSFCWDTVAGRTAPKVSWIDCGTSALLLDDTNAGTEGLKYANSATIWLEIVRNAPHPVDIVNWTERDTPRQPSEVVEDV